jgi:hypothetical protein
MPSTLAFVSNIGHNIQLFAKSFRQCIRNCIFDALTKAFFVIFAWGREIADKRAFRAIETSKFTTSSTMMACNH